MSLLRNSQHCYPLDTDAVLAQTRQGTSILGKWWPFTSVPINLILSLIFGLGQIVAGILVARYSLRQGIWHIRAYLLLMVSLWFICSGSIELFVSSMEVSQRLGAPLSHAAFDLWRGRADSVLVIVSALLLLALLAYPVLRKLHSSRF